MLKKFLLVLMSAMMAMAAPAEAGRYTKIGKGFAVYQGYKKLGKAKKVARVARNANNLGNLQKLHKAGRTRDIALSMRDDVFKNTREKVSRKQLNELDRVLKSNPTPRKGQALKNARTQFELEKDDYIRDWEIRNRRKWPTADREIRNERGDVLVGRGERYDAHHILPLELGGSNNWINIVPARRPDQHQAGVHGAESVLRLLTKILK